MSKLDTYLPKKEKSTIKTELRHTTIKQKNFTQSWTFFVTAIINYTEALESTMKLQILLKAAAIVAYTLISFHIATSKLET